MSQTVKPKLIIEWSPGHVIAYQPGNGSLQSGTTIAAAVGSSGGDALIALSRRTSFIRTTRVPNAGRSEIELILRNKLDALFPISGRELAYDFLLTDDVTAEGRLAVVAATQIANIERITEQAKEAGIKIIAIEPAGIGAVEVLRAQGISTAAVVQVAEDGLSIDVVYNGSLRYSRWSGVTDDAAGEIARTFAAAGVAPGITVAAGGFEYAADHRVRQSTLAAMGSGNSGQVTLNIELSSIREKREAAEVAAGVRLSAAVLVAGVLAAAYAGYSRYQAQNVTAQALAVQSKALKSTTEAAKAAQKSADVANDKLTLVTQGFSPAQRFYEIVAIVTNDAPTGVWLTGINLERGKALTVRGTGLTTDVVAAFSQRLAAEDRLRDVRLLFANDGMIENKPVVQFSITGFPVGNLPLFDPKNVKKASAPTTSTTPTTGGSI